MPTFLTGATKPTSALFAVGAVPPTLAASLAAEGVGGVMSTAASGIDSAVSIMNAACSPENFDGSACSLASQMVGRLVASSTNAGICALHAQRAHGAGAGHVAGTYDSAVRGSVGTTGLAASMTAGAGSAASVGVPRLTAAQIGSALAALGSTGTESSLALCG
jgi:hypothetical protein